MGRVAGRLRAALADERGIVLPVILTFSLVMAVGGLAFLSLSDSGSTMLIRSQDEDKALYLAEGGADKAVWKMKRRSPDQWSSCAGFSDSSATGVVIAVYDSITSMLLCKGTVGNVSKTVSIEVRVDRPTDHVIAYTTDFTQHGTAGTLTHGEDSGPALFDALPTIDMAFYQSIADTVYTGDQTFQTPLSPGIHYIDGDADVKSGTVLNGTIVTTGRIRFYGGSTITAQPVPSDTLTYYPAVVSFGSSLSDVMGGSPGLQINGMVYASGLADLNPCYVTGCILAPNVELAGSYDVAYDSRYSPSPPGFIWPVGSFRVAIGSWSED